MAVWALWKLGGLDVTYDAIYRETMSQESDADVLGEWKRAGYQ
jgi:hypothetical protein